LFEPKEMRDYYSILKPIHLAINFVCVELFQNMYLCGSFFVYGADRYWRGDWLTCKHVVHWTVGTIISISKTIVGETQFAMAA